MVDLQTKLRRFWYFRLRDSRHTRGSTESRKSWNQLPVFTETYRAGGQQ